MIKSLTHQTGWAQNAQGVKTQNIALFALLKIKFLLGLVLCHKMLLKTKFWTSEQKTLVVWNTGPWQNTAARPVVTFWSKSNNFLSFMSPPLVVCRQQGGLLLWLKAVCMFTLCTWTFFPWGRNVSVWKWFYQKYSIGDNPLTPWWWLPGKFHQTLTTSVNCFEQIIKSN